MHTIVWVVWLLACLVTAALAAHPLYLGLLFAIVGLVFANHHQPGPLAKHYWLFIQAGGLICCGYLLFSAISVGPARGPTILLSMPEWRAPVWLGGVRFGGPISAEALAQGATRGLQIWVLLALFGCFHALVDHYRVLRLTPPVLAAAGLVVSIGLSFAPTLLRSSDEILTAQRARGFRFRGIRSWLALAAPLLATSLERAVQLAEALDARGYGRSLLPPAARQRYQLSALVGLVGLCLGLVVWLFDGPRFAWLGLVLLLGGGLALLAGMLSLGRAIPRTRYQRERWRQSDPLAISLLLLSLAGVLLLASRNQLAYQPFPQFRWPVFDLATAMIILGLAAPALIPRQMPDRRAVRRRRAPRRSAAVAADRQPAIMADESKSPAEAQEPFHAPEFNYPRDRNLVR